MQYYGYAKVKPPKVGDLAIMVDKNYPRNTRPSKKFKKCTLAEMGNSDLIYVKTEDKYQRQVRKNIFALLSRG